MDEAARGEWIFKTVVSFIGPVFDLQDSHSFWI